MAEEPTPVDELVRLIAADAEALAILRRALANDRPAYTVATLAAALGVTQRVVRNAIGRGELKAVRRGARWLIAADAVDAWAHDGSRRTTRRPAQHRQPLAASFARIDGNARRFGVGSLSS